MNEVQRCACGQPIEPAYSNAFVCESCYASKAKRLNARSATKWKHRRSPWTRPQPTQEVSTNEQPAK